MRALVAAAWVLASAALCGALPSGGGGGGGGGGGEALELLGGARYNSAVRSRLLETGTLKDGFSVAYWFRLSEPGGGNSVEDKTSVAGFPGVVWQLWSSRGSAVAYADVPITEITVGNQSKLFQISEEVSQVGRNLRGLRNSWFHTVVSWNASTSRLVVSQDAGTDLEQTYDTASEDDAAGLVAELSAVSALLSHSTAFLTIGSSYASGTSGEVDDFCVLDRAVVPEEAAAIRARGCLGAADLLKPAGLGSHVLHYSFDMQPGGSDSPLFDSITGYESGMLGSVATGPRGESFDAIVCNACDVTPLARSVLSSAPLPAGQLRFVRPAAASATNLELLCGDGGGGSGGGGGGTGSSDGNVVLGALPADGLTCVYIGDDAAASAALSAAGNGACDHVEPERWRSLSGTGSELRSAWLGGRVLLRFIPSDVSAPGTRNDFNGSCGGALFSATIVTNSRPWLVNSTIEVDEGSGIAVYLPGRLSLFGDAETAGNELVVQIDSVESLGPVELYHDASMADYAIGRGNHSSSCDAEVAAPRGGSNFSRATTVLSRSFAELEEFACDAYRLSGPRALEPGQRLAYLRATLSESSAPASLRVIFRVFDGLEHSEAGELVVQVVHGNLPPRATNGTLVAQEDTAVLVELSALVSDREGDEWVAYILSLPKFGVLYAFQGPAFAGSERRIELAPDGISLDQWVAPGTELKCSSAYPISDNSSSVEQLVGKPGVFPRATFDEPSWQPAEVSTEQWVELVYTTPVFAREVSLYQISSPGACVRVEAWHEDSEAWATLWEGVNQERTWCPEETATAFARHSTPVCSGISRYQLFPAPFRTRRIRLSFRVADVWSSWPALDAVLLTGVTTSGDQLLASPRLWFLPGPDAVGPDGFRFRALDRAEFYSVGMVTHTQPGEVQINVTAVDDPPELALAAPGADGPVLRCGVDRSAALDIAAREADGEDLALSLLEHRGGGEVSLRLGEMVPEGRGSSPARRTTAQVDYVADCAALTEATTYVSFIVVATDPGGLSANLSVKVTVLKESKTVPGRVLQSWMLAQFGLVVTLAFLAAVWVIKFRNLQIVRVAQVPFLLVFLAGVLLNSTAILAIQYNDVNSSQATADLACNWFVWAYATGFNLTFVSLLVKLDRAERLTDPAFVFNLQYGEAGARRRAAWQISAGGMALRILAFIAVDALIILACSYGAPLTYKRRDLFVDSQNNYTLSSSGRCTGERYGELAGLIAGFHLVILAYVANMCHRSRNIHAALSEHKSLTRLLWSNLQTFALAVPVVLLTRDDAVTNTFVLATVIGVTNLMSVVLLIGPHVLRKVQVRGGAPLTLENLRRADESRDADEEPEGPSLRTLTAVWKPVSSLGRTKVMTDDVTSKVTSKEISASRLVSSDLQLAARQQS